MEKKKKTLSPASKKAKTSVKKGSTVKSKTAKTSVKKGSTVKSKTAKARSGEGKASKSSSPRKTRGVRADRIQGIRAMLVEQREKLLSEAGNALGLLPGQILFPDLGDQASAEIDRNFMLRLRGREQKLLKKIDQVLEKIDVGSYGICEVCGCEIEIQRLQARPVTGMCIECKTEQEDEEKLRE